MLNSDLRRAAGVDFHDALAKLADGRLDRSDQADPMGAPGRAIMAFDVHRTLRDELAEYLFTNP